ncbi:MAG: hypothetical protein H6737_21440 [Alphaproteobacteria bacterium]|nr:hypothetical protein [Alphaproteobacteria bacterium]
MSGWLALPGGLWSLVGVRDGIGWLLDRGMGEAPNRVFGVDLAHGRVLGVPYEASPSHMTFVAATCDAGMVYGDHTSVHVLTATDALWSRPGHLLAASGDTVAVGDPERARIQLVDAWSGAVRGEVAIPVDRAAILADGVALVSAGELVRVDRHGVALSRRAVAEGSLVHAIAGELLVAEPELGPEGPVTRLWGAFEGEVRGYVSALAGSAAGLVAVSASPVDGEVLHFVTAEESVTLALPKHDIVTCVADDRALLAFGAFGAAWHAQATRTTRWPGRQPGSGALWDGIPVLLHQSRLFPFTTGPIHPCSPAGATRSAPGSPGFACRVSDFGFAVDQPGLGLLRVWHDDPDVAEGEPVHVELEHSAFGNAVAAWQTAGSVWAREDLVLDVAVLCDEPDDPAVMLEALAARGLPVEPALAALIEAWQSEPAVREALRDAGLHLRATGGTNAAVPDPCLLQLGHDGRGNLWNIAAYPPDPTCAVVRWDAATMACEWVAGSVAELLEGVLATDPRGPRLLRPFPRVLTPAPTWFRMAHVDPPRPLYALDAIDDPLEFERRMVGASADVAPWLPSAAHAMLGWFVDPEIREHLSPWVPFVERLDGLAAELRRAARAVGRQPGPIEAGFSRLRDDREHRLAVLAAGLQLEPERGGWYTPDPSIRTFATRGAAWIGFYVWPPSGRIGVVRIDFLDEGGLRHAWLADDIEAWLAGLPGSLDAEPLPSPDFLACLHDDGVPCPTEERARLKAIVASQQALPTKMAALYRELGWDWHAEHAEGLLRS